jgi:hypothetical protein
MFRTRASHESRSARSESKMRFETLLTVSRSPGATVGISWSNSCGRRTSKPCPESLSLSLRLYSCSASQKSGPAR